MSFSNVLLTDIKHDSLAFSYLIVDTARGRLVSYEILFSLLKDMIIFLVFFKKKDLTVFQAQLVSSCLSGDFLVSFL